MRDNKVLESFKKKIWRKIPNGKSGGQVNGISSEFILSC